MPTTESDSGRIAVGSSSRSVSPALVLAVLGAASFIAALDVWITNVGFRRSRGVGEKSLSNLSWVLSDYAIAYAASASGLRRATARRGVRARCFGSA
jgi:hypothetical protein